MGSFARRGLITRTFLVLIAVFIPGCVILPSFSDDPFDINELESLIASRASAKDVRRALGEPIGVYEDKSLYFHRTRVSGYQVGYGPIYKFQQDHLVAIHFDAKGHAEAFEHHNWGATSKSRFCFKYDICFEEDNWIAPLAPAHEDEEAKRFSALSDKCTVFYYRDRSWFASQSPFTLRIYLNSHLAGITHQEGGYLMWRLQPYRYNLRANSHAPAYMNMRYSFECNAGEIHFIRHLVPLTSRGHLELSEVDVETGKKAINERKRLLDVYVPPKLRPRRYYRFR